MAADNDATTASDVIETVTSAVDDAEAEVSELADGVRIVAPDSAVGKVYGALRRAGLASQAARDGSSENVVFNVPAEIDVPTESEGFDAPEPSEPLQSEEDASLGELFQG